MGNRLETTDNVVSGRLIWPLRAFLGVTFVYAGLQKLTDPGFLAPGSGTYIGTQLQAFSHGSPIGFLFQWFALPFPILIGVLTIATELAVGILVLLGLFTRPAALTGLVLNLIFFLSASWHVSPYFYGSDIVFVMCWLTLVLIGPGPLSVDTFRSHRTSKIRAARDVGHAVPLSRRDVLAGLAGTAVLLFLGLRSRGSSLSGVSVSAGARAVASSGAAAASPSGAVRVASIAQLPANHALAATDPKSGDPAIIVHASNSHYYAYDAVCTHAGCTVGYDPASRLLTCPCHGAQYDPAQGARVVAGPAPRPLATLPMSVDQKGNVYLYGVPGQPPHAPRTASGDGGNGDESGSGGDD